jgi:hypothetical protein
LLFEQLAEGQGDLLRRRRCLRLAEQGADRGGGGRVGGERAELLDHLDHGPVGDPLTVWQAAALDHAGVEAVKRLGDQPRLPGPCLAHNRHELAALLASSALPSPVDQRQLVHAADEALLVAAPPRLVHTE